VRARKNLVRKKAARNNAVKQKKKLGGVNGDNWMAENRVPLRGDPTERTRERSARTHPSRNCGGDDVERPSNRRGGNEGEEAKGTS